MGLTERAPHIGWCVININTDPGKWENVCQEELTHSLPVLVKQMRKAHTQQKEPVKLIEH